MMDYQTDDGVRRAGGVCERHGFVMITSLLVLVAVTALGAGALFLTNMNLRVAENARSSAIARYNADRGLDLALLVIAREYNQRDGEWPSLADVRGLVPRTMSLNGEVLDLQFDVTDIAISNADPTSGVVTVEGRGGANALYRTAARFRGTLDVDETFGVLMDFGGIGFVTPGQLIAHGNAKFGVDVHVGTGITATGRPTLIESAYIQSATSTCSIGSGGPNRITCEANADMPVVPRVEFEALRNRLVEARPMCSVTITENTSSYDLTGWTGQTICVADGVSLEVTGTATGVYVIGEESSTVTIRASATPPSDNPAGVGLKVASGTVIPDAPGEMGIGENTIVAKNSISLARDVFVGQDGIVRTYVATEGDIRFAGAGNQQLYGVFHANGDVCTQGTLEVFYGSILAGSDRSEGVDGLCGNFVGIDFRGNGGLDAFRRPAGAENEEFPRELISSELVVGGVVVVSRE